MAVKLELNKPYTTVERVELICYEKTDKFAFLCPYKVLDDKRVELDIKGTMVYSLEQADDTPIEAIETMLVVAD